MPRTVLMSTALRVAGGLVAGVPVAGNTGRRLGRLVDRLPDRRRRNQALPG